MNAPIELSTVRRSVTTYDDEPLAIGALKQASAELNVFVMALKDGVDVSKVLTALLGLAERLEIAANLAEIEDGSDNPTRTARQGDDRRC